MAPTRSLRPRSTAADKLHRGKRQTSSGKRADTLNRQAAAPTARNKWVDERIADGSFGEPGAGLEAVAAGGFHTLVIDEAGKVWSCGVNDNASLGRPSDGLPSEYTELLAPLQLLVEAGFRATRIVAGDTISAAVDSQGEFRAWGTFRSSEGRCAFSPHVERQHVPALVERLENTMVSQVAAGNQHLVVLTAAGDVYTMGFGEDGQLARRIIAGRELQGTVPEKIVLGRRSRKAVVVGSGENHSFAVDTEGTVWGWGINSNGRTGTGIDAEVVPSPQRVAGLSKDELDGATVTSITGGQQHTLFLTSDGRVYACGLSEEGRLGLPPHHPALMDPNRRSTHFLDTPTQVTFPYNARIRYIACGTHCSFAIDTESAMYSWGRQVTGELGLGSELALAETDRDVLTPREVVRRAGSWITEAVSCGGQHAVALLRRKDNQ
ncbi:RCC1/BLIP-II [Punctularia strigosozonata HHB-11173 SS5]|uniref:RCC1/BLIP-II n=1 Tax=Punctularia strigosozonata (strain HHB-11173) TaxID=741275 RepID=UPI00044175F2|nr:RCC1/BLIP-II [Punctularia strigosozonata HHB-11173 SS5]EIN10074.1 RCC1/BLIP-II [Punctularia strigosozonata HHB-11173 SS5]